MSYLINKVSQIINCENLRRYVLEQKCIPWRLHLFISENTPTIYYLIRYILWGNPNNQNHWDEEHRKSWDSPERIWPTKNKLIMEHILREDRIVDIGCGNGSTLCHIKKQGFTNLYGIEASRYARKRLTSDGIKMIYSVLPKISMMESSVELVILSEILEHIVRRRKLLKEIVRILVPKGKAIITVPNDCLGPLTEKEHVCKYTIDSLNKLLNKFFTVVELKTFQDENHKGYPTIFAVVQKN